MHILYPILMVRISYLQSICHPPRFSIFRCGPLRLICTAAKIFGADLSLLLRRPTFDTMAASRPSIVAWSSNEEWTQLKSWFYDPQPSPNPGERPLDLRQRAVQRVIPRPLFFFQLTIGPSLLHSHTVLASRVIFNSATDSISSSPVVAVFSVSIEYDACTYSVCQ